MNHERKKEIHELLYLRRDEQGIKSDFGMTLLIGGCLDYPGAIAISSSYCSLSGTAFQEVAVPRSIYEIVFSRITKTAIASNFHQEEESFLFDEKAEKILSKATSVLIGNGIARTEKNATFLEKLISFYPGNLILDATALALLAEKDSLPLQKKNPNSCILLTPHLGEARRLFRCDNLGRNPKDYVPLAQEYAKRYDVTLLLKSYSSIVVDKEKAECLEEEPTCALGKAGSGDALAGFLAGLLSYGTKTFSLFDLTCFASEVFHQAAKESEKDFPGALSDVESILPYLKNLLSYRR